MATPQTRYTIGELQAAARERGFNPSQRLIKDWVGLGLLDRADRRGRGRGRGVEASWPQNQKDLLLALLDKRRGVSRVTTLCNLPVAVWLWWGDEYVPSWQALRALTTWAGANAHASWQRACWTAEQLVGRFIGGDVASAERERVVQLIARMAHGQPFDAEAVKTALAGILDRRWNEGPPAMRITPDGYVFLTQARLTAVTWLRDKSVETSALTWARTEYVASRQEYEQLLPKLVEADPDRAALLRPAAGDGTILLPTTVDELFNNACIDLLTLLGIYLLGVERGRQDTS
jgi:hypothetical protein